MFRHQDIQELLGKPPASTTEFSRRLGIRPNEQRRYSFAHAVALLFGQELTEFGFSRDLAATCAVTLHDELARLLHEDDADCWLVLQRDDDGTPICTAARDKESADAARDHGDVLVNGRKAAERAAAKVAAFIEAKQSQHRQH